MGVFTQAGKNEMLNASSISHAALFNGVPGAGGVEASGGDPAYARKALSIPAAAGGQRNSTTPVTFDVAATAVVNHVGYFDAAVDGNLLAYDEVVEEVYGAQGQYVLSSSLLAI